MLDLHSDYLLSNVFNYFIRMCCTSSVFFFFDRYQRVLLETQDEKEQKHLPMIFPISQQTVKVPTLFVKKW